MAAEPVMETTQPKPADVSHYVDISLFPHAEMLPVEIMGELYGQFHHTLVSTKLTGQVGVSLPSHTEASHMRFMGGMNTLRLHGSREALTALLEEPGFRQKLRDYARVTGPAQVPATAKWCVVRRVQPKTQATLRRLYRRAMEAGLTAEQAKEKYAGSLTKRSALPFLKVKSSSTGQPRVPIFFSHEPQDRPTPGNFNSYGLSSEATVPCFRAS